jgi:hypothetical protein
VRIMPVGPNRSQDQIMIRNSKGDLQTVTDEGLQNSDGTDWHINLDDAGDPSLQSPSFVVDPEDDL